MTWVLPIQRDWQSVPGDAHGFARLEAAELGLVDEGAHTDFVEVGHLGKEVADLDIVACFNGQRIESASAGAAMRPSRTLFFKSGNFAAELLDLQGGAIGVEGHTVFDSC